MVSERRQLNEEGWAGEVNSYQKRRVKNRANREEFYPFARSASTRG
jgi:hypothetical protein